MRLWCVGAGAVGGTVAARLARAGIEPMVVDADRDHVRRLRDPGLETGGLDGGVRTKLAAYTPDEAQAELDPPPELILLAVRSQATEAALRLVTPVMSRGADVVSLQNGLNEDTIAELVGAERTIGCVVGFGATWIEPGKVSVDAEGELVVGRLDGSTDDRLARACELLGRAFPTRISDNVRGELWGKMLVNSTTVLGALGGMLTGELLATPDRRRVVAEVVAEGVRVARADGVRLPPVLGAVTPDDVDAPDQWSPAMERALVRMGQRFGAVRSVTWRDFELHRPTEIDAVTGEIVRRGNQAGVAVPLSARVYELLREIEDNKRRPDASNLADAARALRRSARRASAARSRRAARPT